MKMRLKMKTSQEIELDLNEPWNWPRCLRNEDIQKLEKGEQVSFSLGEDQFIFIPLIPEKEIQ